MFPTWLQGWNLGLLRKRLMGLWDGHSCLPFQKSNECSDLVNVWKSVLKHLIKILTALFIKFVESWLYATETNIPNIQRQSYRKIFHSSSIQYQSLVDRILLTTVNLITKIYTKIMLFKCVRQNIFDRIKKISNFFELNQFKIIKLLVSQITYFCI